MSNNHIEVPAGPSIIPVPNNSGIEATPEYIVLVLPLLIAGVKATPTTISALARLVNASARFWVIWTLKGKKGKKGKPRKPKKK